MNKRNAFTLVELLGVIVVLAILSLITIPIISNVITDVKIKSLENSAYGLIEASNLYYAQYGANNNLRFNITGNKVQSSDTDKLLTYRGSVKEGTVIIDKSGKTTICITDGTNSAYKNYNENRVTTSNKKCTIPANTSIVYLDGDATITAYDDVKLTELVNDFESRISQLEDLKDNYLSNVYPVGSIYISMTENKVAKVQEKFGGTWEQLDSGYMLQSTSTSSNQKGGASNASFTPSGTVGDTTLTEDQIPSHTHNISHSGTLTHDIGTTYNGNGYHYTNGSGYVLSKGGVSIGFSGGNQSHTHTFTGTSQTIDTVSPYITVYMYKRTA